ncbi:hypothetical protein AGLY_005028 [Aphis glycines]|uniref:Uncharacterized protein n=1 Tax=Aphis glycines TaxID=307491 RepID=A0A6G0TWU8_APHGL|nr:hypothetical protein AGLY_005028 [Aphis glycines]
MFVPDALLITVKIYSGDKPSIGSINGSTSIKTFKTCISLAIQTSSITSCSHRDQIKQRSIIVVESQRLIIPIIPSLTGITSPESNSLASVPASIMSILVTTAMVRSPFGSTDLAICKLSLVAGSVFAVTTANIIEFGFFIKFNTKSFICCSISFGWPPTGTLVSPGRSTKLKLNNRLQNIFNTIGV